MTCMSILKTPGLIFSGITKKNVCVDLYQGLLDSMEQGETSCENIGYPIIPLFSFVRGPRDLKKWFMSALTLVQRYDKSIYLSPWVAILTGLRSNLNFKKAIPHRTSQIWLQGFLNQRFYPYLKQSWTSKYMGEVATKIQVIEFQRRCSPHVHIL